MQSPHPSQKEDEAKQETSALSALKVRTDEHDEFQKFMQAFRNHLENKTNLNQSSVALNERIIGDLIKFVFTGKEDVSFTGQGLLNAFAMLGDAKSFLRRRGDALSGSYCCKIILASIRVLGLLRSQAAPVQFRVEKEAAMRQRLA